MKKYLILCCAALIALAANTMEPNKLAAEQLVKKWHFKNRVNPDKSANEIAKGTYLDLKKNGEYEAMIVKAQLYGELLAFDSKEFGTWTINEKKQTLTLVSGKQKVVWNIQTISDTELVLVNSDNKAVWTFGDKE